MKTDLIKKLRLKKGCKYILFVPEECMTMSQASGLVDILTDNGFDVVLPLVRSVKGIKVIEQE